MKIADLRIIDEGWARGLREQQEAGAAMVLELRYVRSRRFARARPRAGPRGAANLGT
eukprot:COSAG02_NODE_7310_length_3070_cov_26.598788_1_plen_56_part_10